MNKRNKIMLAILIIILIMILIISNKIIIDRIDENIKKEEIPSISYEIYNNEKWYNGESDFIDIIVKLYYEQGINSITYINDDNQEVTIYGMGKTLIAIDKQVKLDTEYNFKIVDNNENIIQEKIEVTQQELNEKIKITEETNYYFTSKIAIEYNRTRKYKKIL